MKKFRFENNLYRDRILGPKGFVEENPASYSFLGQEEMLELINSAVYQYNNEIPLTAKNTDYKLWGSSSGNLSVDIYETKEEIGVIVYELKRS